MHGLQDWKCFQICSMEAGTLESDGEVDFQYHASRARSDFFVALPFLSIVCLRSNSSLEAGLPSVFGKVHDCCFDTSSGLSFTLQIMTAQF